MLAAVAAICAISLTGAQDAKPNMVQQGWGWVQGAWSTVEKQGKPAAERLVKEYPQRFKALPKRAAALHKEVSRSLASLKLEEKQAMLRELWRIRQGLNVMALLDSGLLEQLTGIDSKLLKSAQQQVASLSQKLQK